jgi:hypothetical protein
MAQNITKFPLTHTAAGIIVGANAKEGRMDEGVQLDESTLERLLREAEAAHAAYEQQTGTRDDNWPAWYAHYILDRLRNAR